MATGPDDVRFQGKNGSSQPTAKMTRLMLWTVADALHFARVSEPRDFRVFQHNRPKADKTSANMFQSCLGSDEIEGIKTLAKRSVNLVEL